MIDRAEFLADRRTGIGGSDVAAILRISKWGGPYTVWLDKLGLLPDDETSDRQQIGLDMEPVLAGLFERKRPGLYVRHPQLRIRHRRHEWARVTPDGFVYESPKVANGFGLGGFEAKTADRHWRDEIPAYYQAQAQWAMLVTGCRKWFFGVMFGHFQFEVYELDYDPADARYIAWHAARFWHEHVLTGIPPEPDALDNDALGRAFTGEGDDRVSVDIGPDTRIASLRQAKDKVKWWENQVADLTAKLKAEMGDAHVLLSDGVPVASWTPTRPSVDVAALARDHPEQVAPFLRVDLTEFSKGKGSAERKRLADQYRTLPGTRPFRLIEPKEQP